MDNQTNSLAERVRRNLALLIISIVTLGLTIITIVIIINAYKNGADGNSTVKEVFHSLLPVLASWVGTVLAFYFGKENFEAASKSVQDMVKQITNSDDKLKATKVSDTGVMRILADISFNTDIEGKDDKGIKVKADLLDFIEKNKKGDRLPIINAGKVVRYIIHESTINEFARKLSANLYSKLMDKKLDDVLLDDMINNTDDDMKNKVIKSLAFVSKGASLFEVKEKMKANQHCQDVFVTENGLAAEPVIGWITNNKIVELSRI